MKLRNVSPLGHLDLPLVGRTLEPNEEFDVPDEVGEALLEQEGNYERADQPVKARKPRAPKPPRAAAGDATSTEGNDQ